MKLFNLFKLTFKSTFADLAGIKNGRVGFYVLYALIFSVISAIMTFISLRVFMIMDPPSFGSHWIDDLEQSFESIGRTGAIGVLLMIFLMPYYKVKKAQARGWYGIGDLFTSLTAKEWILFFVGTFIALAFPYFLDFDGYGYYGPRQSGLDAILAYSAFNSGSFFEYYFETWMYYLTSYIPLIIMAAYMISLKHNSLSGTWIKSNLKNVLVFFVIFVVLTAGFQDVIRILNDLVLGVIIQPFLKMPIVGVLLIGGIYLFISSFFYMVMSKLIYYSFFPNTDEDTDTPVQPKGIMVDDTDLLDQ